MIELVIVGIVSALVGAAAGIKGLQRHQARLEAQRKAAAYAQRVRTRQSKKESPPGQG